MRRIAAKLFRSFLQGLILLSPIAITVFVLYWVFDRIDSLVYGAPRGLGFVIVIFCVTLIGYLGTKLFIGKWVFDAFGYLLEHTPGVKYIYSSVKDMVSSFVGDKKRFNMPVWVCTNLNPEIWRIGFMTQRDMAHMGMANKAAVYLPHAYAISGYVILADTKYIKPVTRMNAAEAMKFAVSGGITNNEEERKHDTEQKTEF